MATKDWKITQRHKTGKYIHWSHNRTMRGINITQLSSNYGKNSNMWEVSIDYSGSSASEKRLKTISKLNHKLLHLLKLT